MGRLGCLAAGCCYGHVAAGGAGGTIAFPPGSVAHAHLLAAGAATEGQATPPLFATQVYEAAGLAVLGIVLLRARRRRPARPGAIVALYAGGYAVLRALVEIWRGDVRARIADLAAPGLASRLGLPADAPIGISAAQAISILAIGAVALWTSGYLSGPHRARPGR
jgi:prolipoprotein diacylglyceryltransferase